MRQDEQCLSGLRATMQLILEVTDKRLTFSIFWIYALVGGIKTGEQYSSSSWTID